MSDLESHWLAKRLAYLGSSFTTDSGWSFMVRGAFPRLRSNPEAESRPRSRDEATVRPRVSQGYSKPTSVQ